MKTWLMAALMAVVAVGFMPTPADAKRLGGGGMNRNMPARTAPNAPPPKQPVAPAPGTPAQAAPGAAAAAPAAAVGRSWMGPIAGLAAGLGIAALMSHLGLGEAFGNFLMLALLAVAAIFLIRFLMRRFGPAQPGRTQFAAPGAGAVGAATPAPYPAPPTPWSGAAGNAAPQHVQPAETLAETPLVAEPAAVAALPQAFVPATFDSEAFERVAKMIFIRMQAANDSADLNDLRSFTTPEMFAAIKLDLQERSNGVQHTDVVHVDAKVLDVSQEDERQVVSVRFHGQLREEDGGPLVDFDEVWHLVKPLQESRSWAIAGIEQSH